MPVGDGGNSTIWIVRGRRSFHRALRPGPACQSGRLVGRTDRASLVPSAVDVHEVMKEHPLGVTFVEPVEHPTEDPAVYCQ